MFRHVRDFISRSPCSCACPPLRNFTPAAQATYHGKSLNPLAPDDGPETLGVNRSRWHQREIVQRVTSLRLGVLPANHDVKRNIATTPTGSVR